MKQKNHALFDAANEQWQSGDTASALAPFMKSAESGDTWSYNSLGYFFAEGIGVSKSPENAQRWYLKSALSGDACGCLNLAIWYENSGNTRRARIWFERAIEQGELGASFENKMYPCCRFKNAKSYKPKAHR